jgi:PAS domain-containing protein
MGDPDVLRLSHGHLASVLPSRSSLLIALDPAGAVLVWNAAAELAFGLTEEAMRGRPFLRCPIAWDWGRLEALIPGGIPRTTRRIVMDATCRDGSLARFAFQVKPQYRSNSQLSGCLWLGSPAAGAPETPVPEVPRLGVRLPSDPEIPAIDAQRQFPVHAACVDGHLASHGEDPARWRITDAAETRLDERGMEVRFHLARRSPPAEAVVLVLVARGELVSIRRV